MNKKTQEYDGNMNQPASQPSTAMCVVAAKQHQHQHSPPPFLAKRNNFHANRRNRKPPEGQRKFRRPQ